MPKRREDHEEVAQAKPQSQAAHHENDGMACRDAMADTVRRDYTDERPRRQRGDAEGQEDSNRQ